MTRQEIWSTHHYIGRCKNGIWSFRRALDKTDYENLPHDREEFFRLMQERGWFLLHSRIKIEVERKNLDDREKYWLNNFPVNLTIWPKCNDIYDIYIEEDISFLGLEKVIE